MTPEITLTNDSTAKLELFIRRGIGGETPSHGFFSPLTQITPLPHGPPTNFVRRMWKN